MKNKIFLKISCMLVISLFIISSIGVAQTVYIEKIPNKNDMKSDIEEEISNDNDIDTSRIKFVVWDNWMDYRAVENSYHNESAQIYKYIADDFQFEEETEVFDVHWIGGYIGSNYQGVKRNWNIIFYNDSGDGEKPGGVFEGPFTYSFDQCNPEIVYEDSGSILYEFSVNLPKYINFLENTKYWILIWGDDTDPEPILGIHDIPIKLNYTVKKTNAYDWIIMDYDICFQLTTIVDNEPPEVKIKKPIKGLYINNQLKLRRFLRPAKIIGDITINVTATDDESGIQRVEFYTRSLDKNPIHTDYEAPYNFTWERTWKIKLIHIHVLKVVAYDFAGNKDTEKMIIRRIL